ncbi:MAG TPA: isoprenylcysteine carboxylmethyltransferase family protein [Casimicrobiaceae bacterium]|nr:isoprenylcysteine carboxylmethyltransferase family protein [Casimicrobiaceae bacterium]
MADVYRYLFPAMWLTWAAYWFVAARNVKATAQSESFASRLVHLVPLMIAVALLVPSRGPVVILGERFLPIGPWPFWLGAVLTLTGLLFSVWARVHLGANWSGMVTIKKDHELVVSGPYRFVRHPIYSGLLLAFVGSALARAEWRGVLAAILAFWALWRKLRVEERRMRQQFGSVYDEYASHVPALVPFIG